MILLDTNVISELLRRAPDERVIAWIDAQPLETLYLSAITVAELRAGVALLPAGRRKEDLRETLEKQTLPAFIGRVLSFDTGVTQAYANLIAGARANGTQIATADGFIAAIAVAHGLMVATRDTRPFEAAAIGVINPWQT